MQHLSRYIKKKKSDCTVKSSSANKINTLDPSNSWNQTLTVFSHWTFTVLSNRNTQKLLLKLLSVVSVEFLHCYTFIQNVLQYNKLLAYCTWQETNWAAMSSKISTLILTKPFDIIHFVSCKRMFPPIFELKDFWFDSTIQKSIRNLPTQMPKT